MLRKILREMDRSRADLHMDTTSTASNSTVAYTQLEANLDNQLAVALDGSEGDSKAQKRASVSDSCASELVPSLFRSSSRGSNHHFGRSGIWVSTASRMTASRHKKSSGITSIEVGPATPEKSHYDLRRLHAFSRAPKYRRASGSRSSSHSPALPVLCPATTPG